MTELYLTYSESRSGGDIYPGMENDSWPDYQDEFIDFSPESLYLDEQDVSSWRKETIKIDEDVSRGDIVFLVIVRYGDGGTFGRTLGYWQIFGATKDGDKARELSRAIPNGDWKSSSILSEYSYDVWSGYFSSFEGVDVFPLIVV